MRQITLLIGFLMIIVVAKGQDISKIPLMNVTSNEQESVSEVLSAGINVVIFVDVSCPYVEAYQQRISDLSELLKEQGYKLVFINPHHLKVAEENSQPSMKQQVQKYGWKGKYYADPEQKLAGVLKATKIPELFIVNFKAEKLDILYGGAIDDNPQNQEMVSNMYVKDALHNINEGKAVQPKKVAAIGCRIMKF